MRAAVAIVTLLLGVGAANATVEPAVLYVDAVGELLVGPSGPIVGLTVAQNMTFSDHAFAVDSCHIELRIPIDWRPGEHAVDVGSQGVGVKTVMSVEVIGPNGDPVPNGSASFPGGWGTLQVQVPPDREYVVRLFLEFGVGVDYRVKVFGWVPPQPPASCAPG